MCERIRGLEQQLVELDNNMKHILTIVFVALTVSLYSQEVAKAEKQFLNKNSVQLELFGQGGFYSVNYERVLINQNRFKTTVLIGFSYYEKTNYHKIGVRSHVEKKTNIFLLPVTVNEILSFNKHQIELGVGYLFKISEQSAIEEETESVKTHYITGRLGYRYQKPNGRLILRAGFTPIYEKDQEIYLWGGLSVGYAF